MGGSTPAISVLMPVHDAGRFLAPAVESILAQSFADFELIAIDDGSRDASAEVLARFAARDPRIRVVRQENRGLVASLNRALELARAELVARMDADDVARPDRFAKQVDYLRQHPEIAALSGAMDVIDEAGTYLRTAIFPTAPDAVAHELMQRCCVCHPAVMARTRTLRALGGYRGATQHAEDYDLWLRLAEIGRIANLPDVLLSYRLHPKAVSARHIVAQELATLAARGAARLRRRGEPDPLDGAETGAPGDYAATGRMLADVMPRPEFALAFFRAVLGRESELGSIGAWSRLYARHGLVDLDSDGAAMMILLLGHNMLRRRRSGARAHALLAYPWWMLVTALRHPAAALRILANARHWMNVARARPA